MTNGEKIKEIFPSMPINVSEDTVYCGKSKAYIGEFSKDWWNADYKESVIRDNGVKDELNRVKNELESTTKNDLANDVPDINVGKIDSTTKNCESCKYYGSHHEVCNYCYKCSLWTEKELTTKNDLAVDCVSRILVQSAISKSIEYKENPYQLYKRIERLPSVTPQEPRKGHWIVQPSNKEQGERDFIWWKCSECGQVIFSETEKDRKEFHAFCGRCGAKMVEA